MGESIYDFVKKAQEQKKLYHAKVLTDDAIYTNLLNAINIEPLFMEYSTLTLPQFNLSALSFTLLFDISPYELAPFSLEFKLELPSLEEFKQGILIKLTPIDITELFDWAKDLESLIKFNFEDIYAGDLLAYRVQKGVYGSTRYDFAYYDPPVVREFIRSTVTKVFQEKGTYQTVKQYIETVAKTQNINTYVAMTLFERLSMVSTAQTETFMLGYSVLGKSKLGKKVARSAEIAYIDYDLKETKMSLYNLANIQYGMILGKTPLGYGFLTPEEDMYKKERYTSETGFETRGSPEAIKAVGVKLGRLRGRFSATALAIANYSKAEERESYLYSERADQYMSLQLIRYSIENMVDSIIRKYEASPVKIRMYKSAVLQLISYPAKRHKWGYDAYKAMSDEEFKSWWIERWVQQGLNSSLLNELYEAVRKWMKEYRNLKLQQGLRLKQRRYQLALSGP